MEENKELAATPVLLPENSTPQKYFLTRHEWYEVRATATYEVMANSHEEAVSKVERFDEIGGQPDCQMLNIMCDDVNEALEELPLETDEDAVVILENDIFRPEHSAKSAAARTKKLPIKPYYSGMSYKGYQEPEQATFVIPYVLAGHDGDLTPQWIGLGIFRSMEEAREAVQKYADLFGSLSGDEILYHESKEGEILPGFTDISAAFLINSREEQEAAV